MDDRAFLLLLHVIQNGRKLHRYYYLDKVQYIVMTGHVNMRVQTLQDPSAETFSKQLLDIGNGKVAVHENTGSIKLPPGFCAIVHSQDVLIDCIFPDVHTQYINLEWLAERAILAAKNVDVHGLNFKIQQLLPTDSVSYKSVDIVCNTIEAVNYQVEFFNSLDLPGMPPHHLQLKVGSPVILLRNLNPPRLCNGTRLVIKKLMTNVIEATTLNGKFQAKSHEEHNRSAQLDAIELFSQ
ncbi:uncharacterized protein LOC124461284 [Drosophila willistoni]|uniref:uncharacterized protein LOC124461284 n=1 Tax=Drosophila willistoni TaxID=7260 RepID=UPI001F07A124|nr:uncharacterized protein LOC124461284 [Drosophila willistoni]